MESCAYVACLCCIVFNIVLNTTQMYLGWMYSPNTLTGLSAACPQEGHRFAGCWPNARSNLQKSGWILGYRISHAFQCPHRSTCAPNRRRHETTLSQGTEKKTNSCQTDFITTFIHAQIYKLNFCFNYAKWTLKIYNVYNVFLSTYVE